MGKVHSDNSENKDLSNNYTLFLKMNLYTIVYKLI